MRQPTPLEERWRWWEAAVSGAEHATHAEEPQAGFYAVRKFRYGEWPRGPFVPARIWWESGEIDPETGELTSDERLLAEIDGQRVNPWEKWTWIASRPITFSEWSWLRAQSPLLPEKPPPKRPR